MGQTHWISLDRSNRFNPIICVIIKLPYGPTLSLSYIHAAMVWLFLRYLASRLILIKFSLVPDFKIVPKLTLIIVLL